MTAFHLNREKRYFKITLFLTAVNHNLKTDAPASQFGPIKWSIGNALILKV